MKNLKKYILIKETANIIAVNKASGISVTADRYVETKERLDKLLETDFNIPKIYLVHRIDKETSGVVVFAKNSETHRSLSSAFENRKIVKRYICIVHGRPSWKETVCDLPLVPNGNKRHLTIIDKYHGKKSSTKFIHITSAGNYSVLEALPETGRIHQIRVHLAALGNPVVCDELYGNLSPVKLSSFKPRYKGDPVEEKPLLSRLGLHALEIILPDGEIITASLPRDMAALIKQIQKEKR